MAKMVEVLLGATAGETITVTPDRVVVTDGPSHRAVEAVAHVAAPDRVVVIFDHDVPTGSPEGADILGKIRRFARAFGCRFVQSVGVGYQWMLNEVVTPCQIVVGGGSHSGIYGAAGALGLNVSPARLGQVLETGQLILQVPQTMTVTLEGELKGATALDLGLWFLERVGAEAEGKAIQFVGGESLTAQERAILCGMACGTGAVTALFGPGDAPDLSLELSEAVPMVKLPCDSREEQVSAPILSLDELGELEFHAGQIGGFTGGTIEDLRRTAQLMEGRALAPGFRLSIVPATSRDYLLALNEGLVERFLDFNAQILSVGDRSVVWQGAGVVDKGERLITTGLYTFDGCMGVPGSQVYTAGVDTVMAMATRNC